MDEGYLAKILLPSGAQNVAINTVRAAPTLSPPPR